MNTTNLRSGLLVLSAMLLMTVGSLRAQSPQGTITGTITTL
jgi:hypothetical protein